MKVEDSAIIEILHKYDTIASEVNRLALCLEINDDDDLQALLPELDFELTDHAMGMNIIMTPSDDNIDVYPCDVTIKLWLIPSDPERWSTEDTIFEICDGKVTVNKFDSKYDLNCLEAEYQTE